MCTVGQRQLCSDPDCIACYEKSFASSDKTQYWSSENSVTPRDVLKNSSVKYQFNCPCGHAIFKPLHSINQGAWCPYCSNPPKLLCESLDCVACFNKSFASSPKQNCWSDENVKTSRQVFLNDNRKYLFNCTSCDHTFSSALNAIARGNWCPYCSGQKLCEASECASCYERSFASSDKAQFWSSDNTKSPRQVALNDNHKYLFDCVCGHEFSASLNSVNGGNWCSYCAKKILCIDHYCPMCFDNSFASSPKALFWSMQNTIDPRNVFKSSGNRFWFTCECGHEFDATLDNIQNGNWCPFCSNKKLCDKPLCNTCFGKSFVSSPKSEFWSTRNTIVPRQIFLNSSNKYWFNCTCGHEFDISPSKIAIGRWCPYCADPPKKLCDNSSCAACFYKSFASSLRVDYWLSDLNSVMPRDVFKSSHNKYWFICDNDHEFHTSLSHVTNGKWCPYCKNKTETKFIEFIKSHYPNAKDQVRFEWCKNQTYLPFDIVIEDVKIAIELDGAQHFRQVSNWAPSEETRDNDIYKISCALEHGYTVIHILQEYVENDKNPWQSTIISIIELYGDSHNVIFINSNGEYKEHAIAFPNAIVDNVEFYKLNNV